MIQSPRIFLIAGSAEKHSHVRASLDILVLLFLEMGAQPHLWDLTEQPLPLFIVQEQEQEQSTKYLLQQFLQLTDEADAFVLGSPVYHNSFSGILKNALDTLTPQHFHYKPVALISNGSSDRTASLACEHLRSVVKGLSAVAIPSQLATLPSDFLSLDNQYVLTNTSLLERFAHLARELLYFTNMLRNATPAQVSLR